MHSEDMRDPLLSNAAQDAALVSKDDRPVPKVGALRLWARRVGMAVLALAAILAALVGLASLATEWSYWARILVWNEARFDDFSTKFAARPIPNGPDPFSFRPAAAAIPPYLQSVAYARDQRRQTGPLQDLLASSGTTAFLAIQDDRLLYEGYFNGSSHDATQTSFSVAKSFVSAMTGAAIADGAIGDLDDPVVKYLPELAARPGLHQISIRHLLSMASGLRYNGTGAGGGPFGDDARTYYDPNLRALALGVEAEAPPGSRFQYNNDHPLLLGLILERATGRSVSDYLSARLWRPLGMEAAGSWSLDSRHDGFEKMESGLNARAIDFAKLGVLYLNGGAWQGRQILPKSWIEASTRHDPAVAGPATSPPGEEWARLLDYGYLWWIDPKAPGRFFAMGNMGQFIYVAPDRDAVIVRFGTRFGGVDWIALLREVASQIP